MCSANLLFKIFSIFTAIIYLTGCGETDDSTDKTTNKKKINQSAPAVKDSFAKVIYGEDNRHDLYEVENQSWLTLADSTVALIRSNDIENHGDISKIISIPYATSNRLPLCPGERFREQNVAAFCSGFLIAKNLVVTAGHCVQTQGSPNSDCTITKFIFGFGITSIGETPETVNTSEVYSCKRVVYAKLSNNGPDFSIVELDRDVMNHKPLTLRQTGVVNPEDSLVVVGHPSGLPTKISDGAQVREVFPTYFRANLDTYGGNSGSAVFNARTGEVEGVLVRGEQDFVAQGNCYVSKVCENFSCRGEDATRVSEILPYLPIN